MEKNKVKNFVISVWIFSIIFVGLATLITQDFKCVIALIVPLIMTAFSKALIDN